MRTNNNLKIRTNAANQRSYFDWGSNMQIVRKGNGDIAMTEGELVDFFCVTWRKLNYRLQLLLKTSSLHLCRPANIITPIFLIGKTDS